MDTFLPQPPTSLGGRMPGRQSSVNIDVAPLGEAPATASTADCDGLLHRLVLPSRLLNEPDGRDPKD